MASQSSVSDAASAVAIKNESDADTDDEAVLPAASKNSVPDAAAMVAIKTEYNADTDDEEADRNSASGVAAMVAVKTEYDADTDSDEEHKQSIKKAKRDDNEHEKYIAEIRKITDQLISLGRHDGAMLKRVHRIANELASFSIELKKTAYDVEEKLVEVLVNDSDSEEDQQHRAYLCSSCYDAGDGCVRVRWDSNIGKRVRVKKSRVEDLEDELEKQRALEESRDKFERKNGLKVWVRDSDNPNAQQHLAYLCSGHNGADDGHYVWIRWDADIGKRVRVPKSRMKDLNGAYSKIYAWCAGFKLLHILPYNRFVFWRNLLECKTWGDIKAMCNDEEIEMMKDRYERRCISHHDNEEDEKHINNLTDDTVIDFVPYGGDFDLREDNEYGDATAFGMFPPVLEELMHNELDPEMKVEHQWMRKYGKIIGGWSSWFFEIDKEEQEAIFKDMEKRELVAMYCPQMGRILTSYHDIP